MVKVINNDLKQRIEHALNALRPYLQKDNGDVSIVDVTSDMTLQLKFHGACSSCSMSAMTLKAGIEQEVLRLVPEIKSVVAVNE